MATITEHNRGFPPDESGELAGVVCPLCRLAGTKKEMRANGGEAHCPRCLFSQRIARR